MARAAFLLIRIVALYLAVRIAVGVAQAIPFSPGSEWPKIAIPYGTLAILTVVLWFYADTLAKKVAKDADLWLPGPDDEDPDVEASETETHGVALSRIKVTHLLRAALLVTGIILAAEGLRGMISVGLEAALWERTLPLFGFDPPIQELERSFLDRLHIPAFVTFAVELAVGLLLIFGSGGIAGSLMGTRRRYATEPDMDNANYDDEDEDEGPMQRVTTDL
jgi:hypothetical protein